MIILFKVMDSRIKTGLIATPLTLLVVFLWEHFAKNIETFWTPTSIGNWVLSWFKPVFHFIGYCWGEISSFIARLDLTDLFDTAGRFWQLFVECLLTVWEIVKEYKEVAARYEYPLVITGSIVLLAGLFYLYYSLAKRGFNMPKGRELLEFFGTEQPLIVQPEHEESVTVSKSKKRTSVGSVH